MINGGLLELSSKNLIFLLDLNFQVGCVNARQKQRDDSRKVGAREGLERHKRGDDGLYPVIYIFFQFHCGCIYSISCIFYLYNEILLVVVSSHTPKTSRKNTQTTNDDNWGGEMEKIICIREKTKKKC